MQKIYPKINQKIYAETIYAETYCLCRKFMQKLQTVTRKFVQKITVYAEIMQKFSDGFGEREFERESETFSVVCPVEGLQFKCLT